MTTTATDRVTGRVLVLAGAQALLDHRTVAMPPAADVVRLIELASWVLRSDAGVLLIDGDNAALWDLPSDSALGALTAAGWTVRAYRRTLLDRDTLEEYQGPVEWIKLRFDDPDVPRPDVHLGLTENLTRFTCPLLAYDTVTGAFDPHVTADNFTAWHERTGQAWFGTAGLAGSDVLEPMLRKIQPRPAITKPKRVRPADAAEEPYTAKNWRRPADSFVPYPYAHGYDATRMYLAAAMNVEVAPWTLQPTGPIEFNKKLAGWWLIDVPAWNDPRLPDPAGPGKESRRWVTTPTATLLAQLADEGLSGGFVVLDSYTGTSKRLFREWAYLMNENYVQARQLGAESLSEAFKQAGAREVIGLLNSRTYTTYRPDWYSAIVAMARVNLWRKVRKVADEEQRYPIEIDTDCVWYGSDTFAPQQDPISTLTLGDGLGQFKIKGTSETKGRR